MATEIKVPTLGESVTEATIGKWFKKVGDAIAADEPLVELETDKVTVEVPAPAAGTLAEIVAQEGETVGVGALLGSIGAGGAAAKAPQPKQDTAVAQASAPTAASTTKEAAAVSTSPATMISRSPYRSVRTPHATRVHTIPKVGTDASRPACVSGRPRSLCRSGIR